MKRKITICIIALLFSFIFLKNCGFQIGDIRVGKQSDLVATQNKNFVESDFYKKYYSKKELIVLNLWATWCSPCVSEMPLLNKVKSEFKESNIKFLSISIDTDSVKLINFNNTKKFNFEDITLDNISFRKAICNTLEGKAPDKWIAHQDVPIIYLIKNGKVVQKIEDTVNYSKLKTAIEKYK